MLNLSAPKKQYNPPILIVHGTVKDLTQKVGVHGTLDSGTAFGRTRTGL